MKKVRKELEATKQMQKDLEAQTQTLKQLSDATAMALRGHDTTLVHMDRVSFLMLILVVNALTTGPAR